MMMDQASWAMDTIRLPNGEAGYRGRVVLARRLFTVFAGVEGGFDFGGSSLSIL